METLEQFANTYKGFVLIAGKRHHTTAEKAYRIKHGSNIKETVKTVPKKSNKPIFGSNRSVSDSTSKKLDTDSDG